MTPMYKRAHDFLDEKRDEGFSFICSIQEQLGEVGRDHGMVEKYLVRHNGDFYGCLLVHIRLDGEFDLYWNIEPKQLVANMKQEEQ